MDGDIDLNEVSRVFAGKYTIRGQKDRIDQSRESYVVKGKSVENGELVALKIMLKQNLTYLKREIINQRMVVSPYILELLSFHETDRYMILVLEYCEEGNLSNYMKNDPLDYESKVRLLWEIVEGMKVVWMSNILHRDLKPENILLKKNKDGSVTAKVADFGRSRTIDNGEYTQNVGTKEYKAPEVKAGREYDNRADVWSLGILFRQVLAPKWIDDPGVQSEAPDEFRELLDCMTRNAVESRLSAYEFVNRFTFLMYKFEKPLRASVHLATHRPSGTKVAVHIKSSSRTNPQEIKTQQHLSHQYIVRLRESYIFSETDTALVTEYCAGCTLRDLLIEKGAVEESKAWTWMQQLAQVVEYMHFKGIVHRHIQLSSVFLTETSLKLEDFSRAEWLSNLTQDDRSLDILGVGKVYYQLITGTIVADEEGVANIQLPAYISSQCRDIITRLLTDYQQMRSKDLLEHQFFQTKPERRDSLRRVAACIKDLTGAMHKYLQNAVKVIGEVLDFACQCDDNGLREWSAPAFALAKACCEKAKSFPSAGNECVVAAMAAVSPALQLFAGCDSWEAIRTMSEEAYREDQRDLETPVKAMRLMWLSAQVMGVSLLEAIKYQQLYQSLFNLRGIKNGVR